MFLWPLPTEAGPKQRQVWPDPLTLALSGGLSHQAGLIVLAPHTPKHGMHTWALLKGPALTESQDQSLGHCDSEASVVLCRDSQALAPAILPAPPQSQLLRQRILDENVEACPERRAAGPERAGASELAREL